MKMIATAIGVFICAVVLGADSGSVTRPVKRGINVIDLVRAGKVDMHLASGKPDLSDPPEDVFKIYDGMLYISGRGFGYMATKDNFGDYHLVVEFKWGPNTWGARKTRTRDNGILVHAFGPHGACGKTWITSVEANIIEGGMGDIIVIASSPLPDGTVLRPSVTCEIEMDRDGERRWKRGAPRQTVTSGRVNWEKRCEDWTDSLGYRGKHDLDAPVGGWNRLEIIAKGDTLQYIFNGQIVNEAFDVKPSQGKVCIQAEGADMFVRRFELLPLGQFKEKWAPADGQ
ncbi:MAG: DUF1080 domain-containing protein [Kiritimatiellae bacterium]|nr:DUF1080 domain-containing protein [Kiritimatiellia bacterium]MDD3544219.1 DUF1080 domain-containing protein [Kiritimatiellia bacterium]MDD4025328.1 DUF1080 domain-containing protein [Kiritimatiellia bacterium]